MNSNMVKPEKFGHFYLVYHFTVPLRVSETMDLVTFTEAILNGKLHFLCSGF